MKRLVYFSMAALMMLVVSCNKDKPDPATKVPEEAVDLGIEMTREDGTTYKLYWAKSNLSKNGLCANPEDYGDYYAWGETEPKSDYSRYTYKFHAGVGKYDEKFSKYNTDSSYGPVDNKTILDPEDDAAYVKLGGKWRMPTGEELTALGTKCNWTWTSDYNGTGVKGRIVTATNGNSIFLPAAGNWNDVDQFYAVGRCGDYWSSSLYTDYPCNARDVNFSSDGVYYWSDYNRCSGQSIRPVWEE